ncbi:MAG TPA: NIPSNAP family protein [Puia sp.]
MKKMIARLTCFIVLNAFCIITYAQKDIYEIRVYKLKSTDQVNTTDNYLENVYLPAMHRLGIKQIGVFKPVSNDTAAIKLIYVIVPYISLDVWRRSKSNLESDPNYIIEAKGFTDADTSHLPYVRVESTLLEAFPDQPKLVPTSLKLNPDALYELRSYESPTEKLHQLKVNMFNMGGEIVLFKRLDFQSVFYADVLSGSRMPNLVYMVVFQNAAARDEHWKAFGSSKEWKTVSTDPQYENNISVSHIDSILMHRTAYSDL